MSCPVRILHYKQTHTTIMRDHVKLFIPGPIEVSPATFAAMSRPMIGHRSSHFTSLYQGMMPVLQEAFGTTRPVYLSTSSAWGVMEGAVRNLVGGKVLNCCCGAFSDKWYDVSLRCGKQADKLQVEWGQPITPDLLRAKLAEGGFDTVTLIHNETSTGVMNPLAELAAVVREFPDVLLVVDSVSSFSAVPIPFDELGLDVLLTGSQKALALPPGLALFAVSDRALARAATIQGRGYYFDFLEFDKNTQQFMTPSTPCLSLLNGLEFKLREIAAEGLANRYERHDRLNRMVHAWVERHGFTHFAPAGYRSKTLTAVNNNRNLDLARWNKILQQDHQIMINMGYGKIKGITFRISNMGDETDETIGELIDALDASLAKL